jgi:hypothetical protein
MLGEGSEGQVLVRPVRLRNLPNGEIEPDFPDSYGEDKVLYDLFFSATVRSKESSLARLTMYDAVGYHISSSLRHPAGLYELDYRVTFLKRLARGFADVYNRNGQPKSFGQLVAWYAVSLKAKQAILRGCDRHSTTGFRLHSGAIADIVDRVALELTETVRVHAGLPKQVPATNDYA